MARYYIDFAFEFFNSSFAINDPLTSTWVKLDVNAYAPFASADISGSNFSSNIQTSIWTWGSFSAISSSWNIPNGARSVNADAYNSFTDASMESFWSEYVLISCEGTDSCMNTMWDFSYIDSTRVQSFGMNSIAYSTIYAPNPALSNHSSTSVYAQGAILLEGEAALAFYQTDIYGSGEGGNITMVMEGFLAGSGATLHCPAGDRCVVDCLGYDSCFNLTLDCDDDAICTVYNCDNGGNIGNWCPIGWNETGLCFNDCIFINFLCFLFRVQCPHARERRVFGMILCCACCSSDPFLFVVRC